MARRNPTAVEVAGEREARTLAGTLAKEMEAARRVRRLTQAQLGSRVGLRQSRISGLERGFGGSARLETWVAIGIALGRPLAVSFSRDVDPTALPRDAGHLRAQELVLRLARRHGRHATFELPTRPADPQRSVDIGIRDDRSRLLILVEVWNRLDDLGAAARSQSRKVAEADGLAAVLGAEAGEIAADDSPYGVRSCWVLVDTAANRALVAAYPEVIRGRLPGSSRGWVRALSEGTLPPDEPGLVWADTRSGRLVEARLRSG
jgi:transcriptional regulator with XRE-family HTH domain